MKITACFNYFTIYMNMLQSFQIRFVQIVGGFIVIFIAVSELKNEFEYINRGKYDNMIENEIIFVIGESDNESGI